MRRLATVKEVMTVKVVTAGLEGTAEEVARLMEKNNIGCVVVVKDHKPVGIVTEKDLGYGVVARNKLAREVRVREIMAKGLKTIKPEATVIEASKLMARHRIRRLPVVKNGLLVGIVTDMDIIPLTQQMVDTLEGISGYVFNLFYKGIKRAEE